MSSFRNRKPVAVSALLYSVWETFPQALKRTNERASFIRGIWIRSSGQQNKHPVAKTLAREKMGKAAREKPPPVWFLWFFVSSDVVWKMVCYFRVQLMHWILTALGVILACNLISEEQSLAAKTNPGPLDYFNWLSQSVFVLFFFLFALPSN